MRNIITICRRELLAFFVSPIAYFVITGFALLSGYFFFNLLAMFNIAMQRYQMMMAFRQGGGQIPNMNQFVVENFLHTLLVILVFLVPVLTMRSIAEERRRGTFELLITSPVSVGQIVLGKFFAIAVMIAVMLGLSFAFPLLLVAFGSPGPELLPILSGFLGTLLCAWGFAAIAMGVSSFSQNQIVAAVSGMVTLLILYVIHSPAEGMDGWKADLLQYLSPVLQAHEMIKGVITTSGLIYFASLMILGLFLSNRALEVHRWR